MAMKTSTKIISDIQKVEIAQSVALIQKHVGDGCRVPCIAVLSVGEQGNLNWDILDHYTTACEVHIKRVTCPADTKPNELMTIIMGFDKDESIDGIILNTPFEGLSADDNNFLSTLIIPDKDIMGKRYESMIRITQRKDTKAFLPLIAEAVTRIITKQYTENLSGICVSVVGRDSEVCRPLVNMLINQNADVRWTHDGSDPYSTVYESAESDVIFTTEELSSEFWDLENNSSRWALICWDLNDQFGKFKKYDKKSKGIVRSFIPPTDLEKVIYTLVISHTVEAYTRHMKKENDE